MDAKNHKAITAEILNQTFASSALKIITNGNVDSDKPGAGGECAVQHFHFPNAYATDPKDVIEKSTAFWKSCMKNAALLARSGTDDHMELALYFIGRGLHCVQDFYAHSNFVALGKRTHWNGKMLSDLNFCLPTPGSTYQKIKANRPGYWPDLPDPSDKSKFLKGDQLKAASFKRMVNGKNPIVHPELHLDFAKCWADRAISKVKGRRAWDFARRGACGATAHAYLYFEDQMKKDQGINLWVGLKVSLLKYKYSELTKAAENHKSGEKALKKFRAFAPVSRDYSDISQRSAGVFKSAQREWMQQKFDRFGGALWNVVQKF